MSNQTLSPFFVFYGTETLFLKIKHSGENLAVRGPMLSGGERFLTFTELTIK